MNDGNNGIPVVIHEEHKIYVPELLFSHLLTSENYDDSKKRIVGGLNGLGSKACLKKGTLVPTFDGILKRIEDIGIGEQLIGDDGLPRKVISKVEGCDKLFEINQKYSNPYTVNENHILCLQMPDHKYIYWNRCGNSYNVSWLDKNTVTIKSKSVKVDNISDIAHESKTKLEGMRKFIKNIPDDNTINISVKDYINLDQQIKDRLEGYVGKCVQWEFTPVHTDPYILGLLLGNNYTNPKILKYLENWEGLNRESREASYKHIPREYIINSEDVRKKLLAGLIDTFGDITQQGAELTIHNNNNSKLISDIVFLIRSLGLLCNLGNGKEDMTSVHILGEIRDIPTLFSSKDKYISSTTILSGKIEVKEVNSGEFVGLLIDGNQRFVLNDFTVTHNCNIYSSHFYVEVLDSKRKKIFKQNFYNNMFDKDDPVVEDITTKKRSYCLINFTPDYKRFGIDGLDDDTYSLFMKRAYDMVACTDNRIKVYINGKLIKINSFKDYTDMFFDSSMNKVYYEEPTNDRWKVCAVYDPEGEFRQISYVNGICTYQGGNHVSHIMNQIYEKLRKIINDKYKDLVIKTSIIRDNITIFIDSVIENPSFNSQVKEKLKTTVTNFGSRCVLSDDFIMELSKTGIKNEIINMAQAKTQDRLKETDGKKTKRITGLKKLDDATEAGTTRSKKCSLILTEGDSAKAFAVSGLSVIGNEFYGVFPLKGKLLNVKEASIKQLLKNEEIVNIKKIIGLRDKKVYDKENIKELRYGGGIIILTDADVDGSHIKGLLINFIHFFWPSLLVNFPDFIRSMALPIIKIAKGKKTKSFYTLTEYEKWKSGNTSGWSVKYYKGLGTYLSSEAKECFAPFPDNLINYKYLSDIDDGGALDLAFNKKRADDRKLWLLNYNRDNIIDNAKEKDIQICDFINKDMIHFSKDDVYRSIPAIDGLKPGQRKIIYTSIKHNIVNKEIKVAQLAGYVSAESNYHHGEASLNSTIVKLAQDYVGSNNINTLLPKGQFGTRILGGKDDASPRYIFTQLNSITPLIFRAEDKYVLDYVNDDGDVVEPVVYAPIIPFALVNGAVGIGTGFSTTVPCYNPKNIIANIKLMLKGKQPVDMTPWYRNFKGNITKISDSRYLSEGVFEIINKNTIRITELPIGTWTADYKTFLESLLYDEKNNNKKAIIMDFKPKPSDLHVDFTVTFMVNKLQNLIKQGTIIKTLKLSSSICTSNMHLHLDDGSINRYDSVIDILNVYYTFRIKMYAKRKQYFTQKLEHDLNIIKYKVKFIKYVINGNIKVMVNKKTVSKDTVINDLVKYNFPVLSKTFQGENKSYDYITDIKIFDLTTEELEKLQKKLQEEKVRYDTYVNTTIEDLWLSELVEFEKAYDKWIAKDAEDFNKELCDNTKSKKRNTRSDKSIRGKSTRGTGRGSKGKSRGRGRGKK